MNNANHPFVKFLNERLLEVLEREKDNTSHVYFYSCNGSWFTFERSAYAVCCRLSIPDSEIIQMTLKTDGRMIAAVELDDNQKSLIPANVDIPVRAFNRWKRAIEE